jgi:murein DD-endopeptidase MepM/ murein hydrolase activator NlpD/nucleoid-associated protein YgaU
MNDVLKKENQEREETPALAGRTLTQRLERLETEARLARRRRCRQPEAREASAAQPRPAAAGRPAPRPAGVCSAGEAPVFPQEPPEEEARPPLTWEALVNRLRRAKRRWRHILREKRARRFPESNRLPIQMVLFFWGMLPTLGDRVREKTWGRRRQAISRYGRARAWAERKRLHPAVFLGGAAAVAVLTLFFSLYTFGTTVTYKGQVVASVGSETAAQQACSDLERIVRTTLGTGYTLDDSLIQYSSGLKARKDVVDGDTFEQDLSGQLGLVTDAYALYVDGEMIGATPYAGALEELLSQLQEGVTDANTISCDFQENVEIKHEYVPSQRIMNLGYLAEMLYSTKTAETTYTVKSGDTWSEIAEAHGMTSAGLLAMNPGYDINKLQIGEVLTLSAAVPYLTLTVTERERYVEQVPYDIQYVDSQYLFKGDTKVLSAGQFGSADVVANVTYVNGEETERTILSSVTLVNPITEQQARGTKERPTWLPTGRFRWPCSGNITSRFGYRNLSYSYASTYHKGIDIANRRGTAICAADGGTVIYAGWMSGYGYLVQIDHGNGYVTYYGHNSSLLVHVGQHVYKGQQISRMGSTGNSTGNHCHFEIRYNGTAKNPLNYLS